MYECMYTHNAYTYVYQCVYILYIYQEITIMNLMNPKKVNDVGFRQGAGMVQGLVVRNLYLLGFKLRGLSPIASDSAGSGP